jgi:ABC-type Fe3+/spermidine/putrescine transport system ATPase subunit
MEGFGVRRPSQLSGGQQQRVALARALVITPDVLLLDEPFGALDRQLREGMQLELKTLQQSVRITTIFVTHDQEEALSMSDRIVVMNKGVIEQIGSPVDIYERPQTTFVARFIGKSNAVPGTVSAVGTKVMIETPLGCIPVSARGDGLAVGQAVECIIRPEKIRVAGSTLPGRDECSARGRIRQIVYQGAAVEYHLTADGVPLVATPRANESWLGGAHQPGAEIEIAWPPDSMLVFRDGKRCP